MIDGVLSRPARFDELFECLFADDQVVRMRAADAIEKVARSRPDLLGPHRARLLTEVAEIDQPSVRWHLAQVLPRLDLSPPERRRAIAILERNLHAQSDLFVTNLTLEALADFARDDPDLRERLIPILRGHLASERKSLAARARRLLAGLGA